MAVAGLKRKVLIILAFLVAVAALVGGAFIVDDQLQFKVSGKFPIFELDGKLAPQFSAQTLDGSTVTLQDLRGRPTVLVFFASFCPVCKVQMPELIEFMRTSERAANLNVYLVNGRENARLPIPARAHILRRFMNENGWDDIPTLIASVEMQEAFNLTAIPALVVLDAEGRVTYVGLSDHKAERIEELVADAS